MRVQWINTFQEKKQENAPKKSSNSSVSSSEDNFDDLDDDDDEDEEDDEVTTSQSFSGLMLPSAITPQNSFVPLPTARGAPSNFIEDMQLQNKMNIVDSIFSKFSTSSSSSGMNDETKRVKVLQELISTEIMYISDLRMMENVLPPLFYLC